MSVPRSIIRVLAGAGALCLSGCCITAAADDAILYDALTDCIDRQFERSPAPDSFGEIDLAADCPDLLLGLAGSDWVDRTALANPDFPNLAQLADLRHFLLGAYGHPENGLQLDYSRLESILAEILDTHDRDRERNWWQRFLDWLRHRHQARDDGDLLWLEELLDRLTLSKTAAEHLAYGVSAVLILLAIALVVNEIRLARAGRVGLRSRRTRRGGQHETRPAAGDAGPGVRQLPPRVPELLNFCIDHLIRNRRLPETRSRTNREFLRHLLHSGDSAARGFDYLLQQAECILYGGRCIEAPTLEQCRLEATALIGTQAADDQHTTPPAKGGRQ